MSDIVQVAFWTQLAGILTAIALLLGVVVNLVVSVMNGRKLVTQDAKADALHVKTSHIEHLVNSASDELKATIVALRADAVLNHARIDELTRLVLAQTALLDAANANIERLTGASQPA